MSKFSIYFVRHGQTFFNLYNRMQGWSDSPLTDKGRDVATKVGHALQDVDFSQFYSSDSKRAMDTAKLIKTAMNRDADNLKTLKNFREVFYGYFEGDDSSRVWSLVGKDYGVTSLHELLQHINIEQTRDMMQAIEPMHAAENNAQYWDRVNAGFDYLKAHHDNGEKILVVSHGTTIRSMVSHFAPDIDITTGPKNGSLTRIDVDGDQIKVLSYAEDLV
ncbi:histidine phosphatase family protein [Lactiplantibacillus fabifermentans]|uniref:Phosphoglycerate mutase n=2 Tax=Lactiplantibacillus fabifermentans TaxID=483011 RepID=A0A0R2NUT4_9LACO|nr:histidine phosphatase family protein [Lactiplantibacillus fabifermentans]ETY75056.1 phosphoglycerate mutase [Lactiplantibacillus fabifermentans T30PCM01]KRO29479.1 phosphoglycerate mutase [Lactiplantibacillus fabifermentans DSM 21115]